MKPFNHLDPITLTGLIVGYVMIITFVGLEIADRLGLLTSCPAT
jgi:hypothetical protein